MNPTEPVESEVVTEEPFISPDASSSAAEAAEQSPVVLLTAEVEKWKDLALRNAAELDNYRKRVARDNQDARAYANMDLLRSLLPIMDNFEMGLEAARAESEKSMIYMGLSMVRRQFTDFLKDMGVEELNPQGAAFDPNLHEAVSQEASAEIAEGQVVRVLRRGFKLKDRLLRAATVVVSSGSEKPAAA